MILLVDFGSQTADLIARRIREKGIKILTVTPLSAYRLAKQEKPDGIIFSGGPSSVYAKGAPKVDKKIFELNIPILTICYGTQLAVKMLGGKVVGGLREYGPSVFRLHSHESRISKGLPFVFTVWMSHGDDIVKLPEGFVVLGQTTNAQFALIENEDKKIFGCLFHPEVEHTESGLDILNNFIDICRISPVAKNFQVDEIIEKIKDTVGDSYVIGAVSGGVDSTVAAVLTAKAIGSKFIPVFVDNGLMRFGTRSLVETIFQSIKISPTIVECQDEMLTKLKGVADPEEKRKIIGGFYIDQFELIMNELNKKGKKAKFLMQGTIYSDVIESKGTKHADKIKSHHNVGGLPDKMKLKLLEPLREFYKDEVRMIGKLLNLPDSFVHQQAFPGPGYAVRIRGEVTSKKLDQIVQADIIVLEELSEAKLLNEVYMSFPIMTGAYSTAVKGDGRFFGEVIALRIVESKDVMTASWHRLDYDLMQRISSRIVNEVEGISRVVYDITTKPPATMEWE